MYWHNNLQPKIKQIRALLYKSRKFAYRQVWHSGVPLSSIGVLHSAHTKKTGEWKTKQKLFYSSYEREYCDDNHQILTAGNPHRYVDLIAVMLECMKNSIRNDIEFQVSTKGGNEIEVVLPWNANSHLRQRQVFLCEFTFHRTFIRT